MKRFADRFTCVAFVETSCLNIDVSLNSRKVTKAEPNSLFRESLQPGPSLGFRSRGSQKPQGGNIFYQNIGCMQQLVGQTWNGGAGTTDPPLATASLQQQQT